ncbi:hypothetical protein T492DRAFT_1057071 [Pavlovales sp. CCMP2436]|nr:hypothetical protein T492DRAFT_1057071 [Pavlovales sp. CCMP2436]
MAGIGGNFTKQQMTGDVSFTPNCLLGNWQVCKKTRIVPQLRPVALRSAEPAGLPCFGDVVLVKSLGNGGVLALSLAEKPLGVLEGEHRKLHCASASTGATARTAFQLHSYDGKTGPVHFDDKVVLVSAGDLFGDEVIAFVHSELPPVGSQASDQRVTLRILPADGSSIPYSAAFSVVPARFDARLGLRGQPIGSDAITLVHARSGKRIAGLREAMLTDFGAEFMVSAQTMQAKGAVHQLTGERDGKRNITGYGVKGDGEENQWELVRAGPGQ